MDPELEEDDDDDGMEAFNMGMEWALSDDPLKQASADGLIEMGLKGMVVHKAKRMLLKVPSQDKPAEADPPKS